MADKKSKPKPAQASSTGQTISTSGKTTKTRKHIDPLFKEMLTRLALAAGLLHGPTELQIPRSSLIDLLLIVPVGISLAGTFLAFLRRVNIIEFKGENDRFNKETFSV